MKTFEPNKTIKELGIDTTRKFVVVKEGVFKEGDILALDYNDDTSSPYFRNQNNRLYRTCLSNLAYYEEEETKQETKEETKKEIKPLPRWVYASDDSVEKALEYKVKYQLIYELPNNFKRRYICVSEGKTLESGDGIWTWTYIAEIPSEDEKVKMTFEEIEQALGKKIEIIS